AWKLEKVVNTGGDTVFAPTIKKPRTPMPDTAEIVINSAPNFNALTLLPLIADQLRKGISTYRELIHAGNIERRAMANP
ncbi:hypothetical protein, partial [Enterobacter hormaechei]|uniref:hypothetical protein n=1 Tax=Enterobacter hormaechei TaxID=158836 RepID=UPI0029DC9A08